MPFSIARFPFLWVPFAALCVFSTACTDDKADQAAHWKAAQAYLEDQEYEKAIIELRNVLQLEPGNDRAFYQLGEAYLNTAQFQDAFQSFHRATLLAPDNLDAQLRVGHMYRLAGNVATAKEKAQLILARSPDHVGALKLLADVQSTEKDTEAAIHTLKRVVSLDPGSAGSLRELARLHLEKGDWTEADEAYQRAARAEPAYQALIRPGTEPFQSLPVLARFHEQQGRFNEAEEAYEQAAQTATGDDVSTLRDLALFHARREAYESALAVLDRALALREDDLDLMANKAEILLASGDTKAAETLVDDILQRYGSHVGAGFLKGKMELARNRLEQALDRFDTVARAKPQYAPVHYYKGLALLRLDRTKPARESLERAVELAPDQLHARLLLADGYIQDYQQGNATLAGKHIEYILQRFPAHRETLTLLGNLRIRTRDYAGAEEAFQQVVRRYPDDPRAHYRLGFVHYLQDQKQEALAQFKESLALDATQTRALTLSVNTLLQHNRAPEALALCDRLAPQLSDNKDSLAHLQVAKARILLQMGDVDQAESLVIQAIQNNPEQLPAHVLLTRIYLRKKKLQEIITHFEATLADNPKFLPAYMVLGMVHDASGEFDKANDYYRQALDVQPDFAPAANNLAWNLAVEGGDLDEAFQLARMAMGRMPDEPNVLDTMGWIHHLLGHHWKAVAELERAVALDPKAPALHYRLGKAYMAAGEPQDARRAMEDALALDTDFPEAEEARRMLEGEGKQDLQAP